MRSRMGARSAVSGRCASAAARASRWWWSGTSAVCRLNREVAMNKIVGNADDAVHDIKDGAVIMSGGFGLCGNPENLIAAIHRKGVKNLTIISNNCGTTDKGLGVLLQSRQVKKMIGSYVGENKDLQNPYLNGSLDITPNPPVTPPTPPPP